MDMVVKLAPTPYKEETYNVVGYEITPTSIHHEMHKKNHQEAHNVDVRSKD